MGALQRGIKNAFRNVIRTFSIVLILGLSIGLLLTMLIARQAVQTKIESIKSSIGNTITISPAGVRGFEGGGEPLVREQVEQVKSLDHIVSVTEILNDRLTSADTNLQSSVEAGSLGKRFQSTGSNDLPVKITNFTPPISVIAGTSLDNLQSMGGGTITIIEGEKFDPKVDANVALVGKDLAEKNSLKIGTNFQAYNNTFTVKGIFDTGNKFSNNMIVIPLSTLQKISEQVGIISSAVVQVDSITNISSSVDAIKNKLGEKADVVSQQDTSNQALAPLENIKSISELSFLGSLITGAVIILLTMMMIVRERRREIGVLKALGATNFKVMTQFTVEAMTLTVMGALLGLGFGVVGSDPITKVLVQNSLASSAGPVQGTRGFGAKMIQFAGQGGVSIRNIQTTVGWEIILYGFVAAIVTAIVGSAIPAWFISKVRPAEVMRAE